jgi:hypothetical protein
MSEVTAPQGATTPPVVTVPTPARPRRPWIWAAAAVAVAVVLVLGLLLAGVIGFPKSSGGGGSGPVSEQTAISRAQNQANGVTGGPWSLIETWGSDTTVTLNFPVSGFARAGCTLIGSTISAISVPAYSGNYSNGLAQVWFAAFEPTSGLPKALFVVVQGTTAATVGVMSGTSCVPPMYGPLAAGTIDSTAAASAAAVTSNVSSYVHAHSSSNASYTLYNAPFGARGSAVPFWDIVFTQCAGSEFTEVEAGVYASNSTVLFTDLNTASDPSACGVTTPIGTAMALGSAASSTCPTGSGAAPGATGGCHPGDFTYTLVVESSSVTLGDFELSVETHTGVNFTGGANAGFAIINRTGIVLASDPTGSGPLAMTAFWSEVLSGVTAGTAFVAGEMNVVVDTGQTSPTTGDGLELVVHGVGAYSGSAVVALP